MSEPRKLTERMLTEWLADYRDSLDDLSTPTAVELRLRAEVRGRRRIAVAPWILASGAAAVLLFGIWIGRTATRPAAPGASMGLARQPAASPQPAAQSPVNEIPAGLPTVEPMPAPPRTAARLLPRFVAPEKSDRQPQASEAIPVFVMLPGSELMPAAQDLQVLRVRIPRLRMQALGWPVNPANPDRLDERVLADVLVGTDGVARAVRLVGANQ